MKGLFALSRQIRLIFLLGLLAYTLAASVAMASDKTGKSTAHAAAKPMHCLAFSPYVGTLNPNWAHPAPALIDTLLDKIVKETPFRCIMTYGVLNGLDYTFKAAKARNLQTIAILWIDKDIEINTQSIARGIALAREFPETIVKISCGSEVRTRHGPKFDSEITRCLNAMKEAKITQPVTTIDTWWEWCDHATPCRKTGFEGAVDWIGVNIFPWWENIFAGKHSCTPAKKAADFTIARMEEVHRTYPDKEVVLTEFGWPDGPEGAAESNKRTGEECGIAGKDNQRLVVNATLKKLKEKHWSGNVFSAFSENWKPEDEGHFGKHWGICQGEPPYQCKKIAD